MHRRAICLCYRSAQESCLSNQPSVALPHRSVPRWQRRRLSGVRNRQSTSDENGARTVLPTARLVQAESSAKDNWAVDFDNKKGLDAKDIYIDDLTATLEAHRQTNRASLIRRVHQDADWAAPFLSPVAVTEPAPESNDEPTVDSDAYRSTLAAPLPEESIATPAREDGHSHSQIRKRMTPKQWASLYWPADSVQLAEITGKLYKAKAGEILEYDACLIQNQGLFSIKKAAAQYPWLAMLRETATNQQNSHQRLHDEIRAYEAYIDLSQIEKEAASLLISDVRAIIGKVYPRNPLQVIGSYRTGLANSFSDIDFNLSFPDFEKTPLERCPSPTRDKARKAAGRALVRMHRAVENPNHSFRNVELVLARVPIVKAEHRGTKLKVEIQALSTNQNAKEYVASYLAEFPTLKTLYTVIRSALHIRDLTNVHKGGLGSYSIFMMIVNALKQASGKFAHDDLANQFLHFLDFYGTADLYKHGFSVDPPRTVLKRGNKMSAEDKIARLQDPMLRGIDILEPYNPRKPYLLFLQDPANTVNDLGRKAYGIKHVQCILRRFSESLKESMRRYDEGPMKTHNWLRTRGFLGNLLKANYESLESNRHGVRSWLGKRKAALKHERSSKSKLEHETQVEAPNDIQATSSGELRVVRSDSAGRGREVLPIPEGNEDSALPSGELRVAGSDSAGGGSEDLPTPEGNEVSAPSTTGNPDLRKEIAPADVQGTIHGESRTIKCDSAGRKTEDLPAGHGKEDPGLSTAGISNTLDEKDHSLPAQDTQQTFSQELINHSMRQAAQSTPTAFPGETKPKAPAHSGWRRWSPSQEDVLPELEEKLEMKAEDRPLREKTDIPTHGANLLQRLEKRFDKSVFEKLKDMDWYTLVRLNWHNLQDIEVDSGSRNQIITTIQKYVARMPYDDLVASQDRNDTDPVMTISTGATDTRNMKNFLHSVGLGRHMRKLKSFDLHQLAAMTCLHFKQKKISIYDANKIMLALQKNGIVAQEPNPQHTARHSRESALGKEATDASFPADTASISISPRRAAAELPKTQHDAGDVVTSVSGLPIATRHIWRNLLLHLGREKSCDLEAAKNLWASYADQERLNLVLAYRRRTVQGITPQIRAGSTGPEPTPEHNPPSPITASVLSPQQSAGSGLDPITEQQSPQPNSIPTPSSQQSSGRSVESTQQQKARPTRKIWRQSAKMVKRLRFARLKSDKQPPPVRVRLVNSHLDAAPLSKKRSTVEDKTDTTTQQQITGRRQDDKEEWRVKMTKRLRSARLRSDKQPTPIRKPLPSTGPDPDAGLLPENRTMAERERDALVGEHVEDLQRKRERGPGRKKSEGVPLSYHPTKDRDRSTNGDVEVAMAIGSSRSSIK